MLCLVLAALTSTISMHEIGTAFIYEEGKISRAKGAWFETVVCCIIAVFCSLSQGAVPDLGFFGKDFLSNCDNFTAQLLMPLGSFITCLFLGWYVPKKIVRDEFTNWGYREGKSLPCFPVHHPFYLSNLYFPYLPPPVWCHLAKPANLQTGYLAPSRQDTA